MYIYDIRSLRVEIFNVSYCTTIQVITTVTLKICFQVCTHRHILKLKY